MKYQHTTLTHGLIAFLVPLFFLAPGQVCASPLKYRYISETPTGVPVMKSNIKGSLAPALSLLGIPGGGGLYKNTGTTYYVSSSSGNDSNDGLSTHTAWQTISRVNSANLAPGDAVLFKRGDTFRDTLVISWSGTPDAYITFSTYGSGGKPKILGSERAQNWSSVAGHDNVWYSATALSVPHVQHPASIFFGEQDGSITWGRVDSYATIPYCDSGFSMLEQECDWCWDDGVYVYSPEDPDTRYRFIEVPQRRGSITMQTHDPKEYIVIDGLEMMFGTMYGYNDGWPMNYEVSGLVIQNCHIGYIGIRGSASAMGLVVWHSGMRVRNNEIHDCGRRSISYNVYTDNSSQPNGLVFENVVFENNTLHHGYHTTGFDIAHGDARQGLLRNFTLRSNLIYDVNTDDPLGRIDDYTSMGIFLWSGAARYENFKIYNNILKNIKQKGFAIGGTSGIHQNLEIYNNVLYGMNPNICNYYSQAHIGGTHVNLKFKNNIMYGTIDPDSCVSFCLYVGSSAFAGVADLDYNLYYQDFETQRITNLPTGTYRMDQWSSYVSDTGWDQHSPSPQDPKFTDAGNDNFTLMSGSIGIHGGVDVGLPFSGTAPHIGIDEAIGPVGAVSP